MAGLLTLSRSGRLPGFRQWQEDFCPVRLAWRLQQRVLLRNYTVFPFGLVMLITQAPNR